MQFSPLFLSQIYRNLSVFSFNTTTHLDVIQYLRSSKSNLCRNYFTRDNLFRHTTQLFHCKKNANTVWLFGLTFFLLTYYTNSRRARVLGNAIGAPLLPDPFYFCSSKMVAFSIFCDILLLVVSLSTRKEDADFSDIDSWSGDDTTFLLYFDYPTASKFCCVYIETTCRISSSLCCTFYYFFFRY